MGMRLFSLLMCIQEATVRETEKHHQDKEGYPGEDTSPSRKQTATDSKYI